MINLFTWTATGIALIGNIFNCKKSIYCFYVWTIANIMWLSYDIWTGLYSRCALDIVQLVLGFYGIYNWKKGGKNECN